MLTAIIPSAAITAPKGEVPRWLHLLPAGIARTKDGRGPYNVHDPAALISLSMAPGKLPIDENHSIDLAAPQGSPSPARGWIVELQQRGDGIWGRVEWTGEGRQIVADRRYRGLSPVIAHRKDGTILAILRASLTNTPNFNGLTSLHGEGVEGLRQRLRQMLRPQLIKILGLSGATDADIIAKVRQVLSGAQSERRSIVRAQLIDVLGLAARTDEMIVAKVRQVLAPLYRPFDQFLAEEPALQSAIGATDERVIQLMGLDRGDYLKALHAERTAKGAVSRHSVGATSDGLTAADERVIRMMGLDRSDYVEALKRAS